MIFKYEEITRDLLGKSRWVVIENGKPHNLGVITQVIKCKGYTFIYRKGSEEKITINEPDKFIIMSETERNDRDIGEVWNEQFNNIDKTTRI